MIFRGAWGVWGARPLEETKQCTVTLALTRDQRVPFPPISDPRFDLDRLDLQSFVLSKGMM
jgi:hypothetical protein